MKSLNIGILPASGSASRLGGIPKFCLPLTDEQSILEWHVEHLLEVCDLIHLSTRKMWMPIVEQMKLPSEVHVYEIEPSSMSDAVEKLSQDLKHKYIIGMPDTYMPDSGGLFYSDLAFSGADVTLAAFPCHADLKGRVGQILIDANGDVLDAQDKVQECEYNFMWGAMALSGVSVDPLGITPSSQIMQWVSEGRSVKAIEAKGRYLDIGTVSSLKALYGKELR